MVGKQEDYSEYITSFFLRLKRNKLIKIYRNSRIKLPRLEGYNLLAYVIYSILICGLSGFFCYGCWSTSSISVKVIGIIALSFSVIAPLLEIGVITGAQKILCLKGLFFIISIEFAILAQSSYNISSENNAICGMRFIYIEVLI